MNEQDLIDRITTLVGGRMASDLVCGIGDDCAVVEKDRETAWLVSVDTLIESVHFDRSFHPPDQLGRKAVAVNVSDVAAMGGAPRFLLLSLALPTGFSKSWVQRLQEGITSGCERYGCLLIGGDTVRSPGPVTLSLTIIGEAQNRKVLYRHAADPGDAIFVSRPLGSSAAGLALLQKGIREPVFTPLYRAHLDPDIQMDLARSLADSGMVHAMMDLSDGLSADLGRLCSASQVQGVLVQEQLPFLPELMDAALRLGINPLSWILSGGEDYGLLLTAPTSATKRLQEMVAKSGQVLYVIGTVTHGEGLMLSSLVSGMRRPVIHRGFDHFAA